MFIRALKRVLFCLGIGLTVVAALLGVPIIIDPPPRDRVEESQDKSGSRSRKRRRQH